MKAKFVWVALALLLAGAATIYAASKSPAVGGGRSDFALFDGTDPASDEIGAQCGATVGSGKNAAAFTYYVTVSNWSDEVKILRVLYADGEEMARYQIAAHTSFSFTQAGGGTAGVDDWIRVFGEGEPPSGLAGSMSIAVPAGAKPHPSVGENFCTTLTAAALESGTEAVQGTGVQSTQGLQPRGTLPTNGNVNARSKNSNVNAFSTNSNVNRRSTNGNVNGQSTNGNVNRSTGIR